MNHIGKKILIIDDNQELRSAFRDALLLTLRCSVDEAKDGREGIAQTRAVRPDLILLDYVMPEVDGMQFLECIRRIPSLCDTPVVIMTSESEKEEVKKFLSLGVKGYLVKPIALATAVDRIVKIIGEEFRFPRLVNQGQEQVQAKFN